MSSVQPEPRTFQVGDVVKLPSCPQLMTVTAMKKEENEAHVVWIAANGTLEGGYFPPAALKLVGGYRLPTDPPGTFRGMPIRERSRSTLPFRQCDIVRVKGSEGEEMLVHGHSNGLVMCQIPNVEPVTIKYIEPDQLEFVREMGAPIRADIRGTPPPAPAADGDPRHPV